MNENNKEKKPFYKRWWVWVIAIIFVIIVSSSGGDDKSNTSTSGEEGSKTQAVSKTEQSYGLKQEAPAGDLIFTANSVTKKKTIGSSVFAKTSQSGTFVIVNMTLANKGKETLTTDSSLFELMDSEGRTFENSRDGQAAVMLGGNDNFFLKQVQPGLSATGDVVFEVPSDASGLKIVVRAGAFSSKKATINLE